MSKAADTTVLDALLNQVKNNALKQTACAGQPATYAAANTGGGNFLAGVTLAGAGADFTGPAADSGGRKITLAQKTGISVTNSGTCDHVALLDTVNTILLWVTTVTSQALTAGNTLTINGWAIHVPQPV